jgi:hypothetical protein
MNNDITILLLISFAPMGCIAQAFKGPWQSQAFTDETSAPVFPFRYPRGRRFNAFAGTEWQGIIHHWCSVIARILKAIAQGVPTPHLAQELGMDRKHLLERRHKIQAFTTKACPREHLPDMGAEADEL